MPIYNLTMEKIEELKEMNDEKTAEYNELNEKKPETIWSEELDVLEAKYEKWYKKHSEEMNDSLPKRRLKNLRNKIISN